ncbi:MAG: AAA family ATPase [Candidatus Bathyarchaeia archaeon]
MRLSIAVSGKGGTGKTTVAALLIKIIWEKFKSPILAIDADPNSNLNEMLGVKVNKTVGDIRESLLREKDRLSPGYSKEDYLNFLIQSSITESEEFDLLVMGRPEGPGCYCYVNHLLRKIIDSISKNYSYVVLDAEAGLEHFSRRTTNDVNVLIVTTDPTVRGIATAKRINELTKELGTKIGKVYVVANRVPKELEKDVEESIKAEGLELIGTIPEDPEITKLDFMGKPIKFLPDSSLAYVSISKILEKILSSLD